MVAMAVLGTLATLGNVHVPLASALLIGVTFLILGAVVAYLRGRFKLIPDGITDEMSTEQHYTCRFCSSDHFHEACDWTRHYYGASYVEFNRAEQWRVRAPDSFLEIVNAEGELCAAFGVLALEGSFMTQFIAGKVTDAQVDANCILTKEKARKSDRLYISGVIVREPHTHRGRKRARVMVWAMLRYVTQVYGFRKSRILYALAVTEESELLLKSLGFNMVCKGNAREDRHDLYSLKLGKQCCEELLARTGDYTKMCDCSFAAHNEPQQKKART
jgi:hypothetical protein